MRIVISAVGRAKRGPLRALFEDYCARLSWPVTLKEVEEKRPLPAAALREREGELLLRQIPDGAALVALDPRGQALSSEDFARLLGQWRDGGTGTVAFAIGGAEGLSPAVLERARLTLSLGAMTWPHLLVRPMLAEQLYRAQAILAGHPYHRA